MMKKVLVTGATGFIGNYVIEQLLQKDIPVIASSANQEKASGFSWYKKVVYKEFDLNGAEDMKNTYDYFDKPDVMIHLAWQGLPDFKNRLHIEKNLWIHYTFLKGLLESGLKDLTITGTCLEYGLKDGELSEDDCVAPVTAYGIAKNSLRQFLEQLNLSIPFHLKWVRLFYMYGRGQHPKSILPQLQAALDRGDSEFKMSGGEQTRDYLPAGKVAKNIIAIALQNEIEGIINCSSNKPVTITQLVEDYLHKTRQSIHLVKGAYPYPDYEPMHFWGKNERLKMVFENGIIG